MKFFLIACDATSYLVQESKTESGSGAGTPAAFTDFWESQRG